MHAALVAARCRLLSVQRKAAVAVLVLHFPVNKHSLYRGYMRMLLPLLNQNQGRQQ